MTKRIAQLRLYLTRKFFNRKEGRKNANDGFSGKQIEVDDDGYIINLDDWSKELAVQVASQDGVTLTDAHWEVINFLRDYYKQYQIAPMIKILVKEIGKAMGPEKGNTKYLYELYPGGPAKQACKYAGLPKPTGCV